MNLLYEAASNRFSFVPFDREKMDPNIVLQRGWSESFLAESFERAFRCTSNSLLTFIKFQSKSFCLLSAAPRVRDWPVKRRHWTATKLRPFELTLWIVNLKLCVQNRQAMSHFSIGPPLNFGDWKTEIGVDCFNTLKFKRLESSLSLSFVTILMLYLDCRLLPAVQRDISSESNTLWKVTLHPRTCSLFEVHSICRTVIGLFFWLMPLR